jgi:hypothetical protein
MTPREIDKIMHEVPLSEDIIITFADGQSFTSRYMTNVHDSICLSLKERVAAFNEAKKDEKG